MIAILLVVLVVVASLAYAIGARDRDEPALATEVAVDVLDALDAFDAEHGFLPTPDHVQTARALAVAHHLTGATYPIHAERTAR